MSNLVGIIVLLQTSITIVQSQNIFESEIPFDLTLQDKPCVTVYNGLNVDGTCSSIHDCPLVLNNVLNQLYNHTKCGYDFGVELICCPNMALQKMKKLDLYGDCKVANTNDDGVIKFLSECPELNTDNTAVDHIYRLCDYEICADLVCCPITSHRLKKICSNVDDPIDTLRLRLLQYQECTVKELNMKGIYQSDVCNYADRNPHLAPLLQNVCNHDACNNWYCCPIEQNDLFRCTNRAIPPSIANIVGPKCVDSKSGRKGTCKEDYHRYIRPEGTLTLDKCGTYCCIDYYCFPDDDVPDDLSMSAKACLSYNKYLSKEEIEVPMDAYINSSNCILSGSVAGGRVTSPGDFPHMAALGYESDQGIVWNCGGSLISDRYVLTAAHCISNRIGPVKKVRLGVVDLLNDVETADCPEEFDVARQIPHPEYTHRKSYNDIGLIELNRRVKFNFHIRPHCLPSSPDIPLQFESMGWGITGPLADETSVKLLKVFQTLFSHEDCDEFYQGYSNRKINRGVLNETQICAGSEFSIESTCRGDSGGPLVARNPKDVRLFVIYGIVSFGTQCGFANSPGIYTKVYPYVKWVEDIVWNN